MKVTSVVFAVIAVACLGGCSEDKPAAKPDNKPAAAATNAPAAATAKPADKPAEKKEEGGW